MSEDVTERIADLETRVAKLERALLHEATVGSPPPKPVSITEFLVSKQPKTDVERTLVLAYYLEKHQGLSSVNINDLKEAFAKAREPPPANVNDAVNKNIQKALMMEVDERKSGLKSWVLTNSGERYVSEKLVNHEGPKQ